MRPKTGNVEKPFYKDKIIILGGKSRITKSKSSSLLPRPVTSESSERLRDVAREAEPSSGVKKQTGITPIISKVGQIMIEKNEELPEILLEPETHKESKASDQG